MKDSFIFYRSFYDAINTIKQVKYKYLLLESVIKLGLFSEENEKNEENFASFCTEIEQKLNKNLHVLGVFFAIKPQLIANHKKYINGCKGTQYGDLGGAPMGNKNANKNNPKTTPNENVLNENVLNENENENVFNVNEEKSEKETNDIFFNPLKNFFTDEYEKVFSKKPYLSQFDLVRLNDLSKENTNFKEIIPEALERLKRVKFDPKINFTPSASWLLKENNFERIMNGEFEPQKTEMELLKEELGIED